MKKTLILISIGFLVVGCSYESITSTSTTTTTINHYGDEYTTDTVDTLIKYPAITDTIIEINP